jgi:hypothetical protein
MPARSSLKRPHPVEVVFEAEGETVTIVFDRNRITQGWAKRIQQGMESQDMEAAISGMLEVLQSWDVVEEDGSPTPLSAEVLSDLPLGVLANLNIAIAEAAMPSSEEGNGSSNTSSTPPTDSSSKLESPPNGQEPLPSPQSSASPSLT